MDVEVMKINAGLTKWVRTWLQEDDNQSQTEINYQNEDKSFRNTGIWFGTSTLQKKIRYTFMEFVSKNTRKYYQYEEGLKWILFAFRK